MRYFVKVAELGSFTAAADELNVAQQAVSQQVKTTEQLLGVQLLHRSPRAVTLTGAGEVYLREAKRVLEASERAVDNAQAAARGEVGTLRVAYTVTSAYETFPELRTALRGALPGLDVVSREIYGGDVAALLVNGAFHLALAPRAPLPDGLDSQSLRAEQLVAAVGEGHSLAVEDSIDLSNLRDEPFELWPRHMAPGFYDAVVAACRGAGFEPRIDKSATGQIVWGTIAEGRGVALIVRSLEFQVPNGVRLLCLRPPQPPPLSIDIIRRSDSVGGAVEQFCDLARDVSNRNGWLAGHNDA